MCQCDACGFELDPKAPDTAYIGDKAFCVPSCAYPCDVCEEVVEDATFGFLWTTGEMGAACPKHADRIVQHWEQTHFEEDVPRSCWMFADSFDF